MKKKGSFWILIICFLLLLTGLLYLLRPIKNNRKDVLIFGRGGDSVTMDPSHATDGETFYATTQIYDTLVQFKYGTTVLEPALATRWTISNNGLEYTFYLRRGVKFHKTKYFKKEVEFTADDVVFSLKRQMGKIYLFSLKGAWSADVKKGKIPSNLAKALQERGKALSNTAKITPDKKSGRWTIRQAKVEYLLRKKKASLLVYQKNPQPYHTLGGSFQYWLSMGMDNLVRNVVKVDQYTIKIILWKREAPFLANLAMNFASILCRRYADWLLEKGQADRLSRYPIGTGPFVFIKWIKDDRIIFQANPHYWNGPPKVKWLILKVISNNSVRAAALKTGQIHIMDFPNPEEIPAMEKDPDIKLIKQEGLNVGYLAMNTEKKPFDNVLVRRAIYYGINKKAIVKAIFGDYGKPAKNPLPPTIWAYDKNFRDFEYNPQKARALLAQAGYPKGFSTDLWAMPVVRPYMPKARKFAEAVQADLKKIGIEIKIVSYDWGTYLDKTSRGEHSMAILGWTGDNGDPDNFLYVLLSSVGAKKPAQNIAFFRNKAFDALLEKAKRSTSLKERKALYLQAQKIFHQQVPWVPLAHSIVVEPMRKNIHGFKLDPVGSRRFYRVWIE